jgi:hypothetical protein
MQTETATIPAGRDSTVPPLFHQIWRPALISFGLGLSLAWSCLLGYGLVLLIELTF